MYKGLGIKISGRVIRGAGYGTKLGYPTANLDRRQFVRLKQKIKLGVYGGTASINSKLYNAGIVIGPIDHKGLPKIEAHIIGWKGNLYGQTIVLQLKKYLRPFRKYSSIIVLKQAIARDVKQVRKLKF